MVKMNEWIYKRKNGKYKMNERIVNMNERIYKRKNSKYKMNERIYKRKW